MKKVISFSLWGENPKYTIGAIKNADLATRFYPDWMCRFYVAKNVPIHVIQELLARNNTEVFIMNEQPDWAATFWRFLAASDPTVDLMISRDADSRLGEREVLAVQAWEHSDRGFHIMRDHPQHGAKILAGMWGIKKRVIPNMAELIRQYQKGDYYQVDQHFLAAIVYPLIHHRALVHDPIFDKQPFPSPRVGYQFVGQAFDEHDRPVAGQAEQLEQFLRTSAGTPAEAPVFGQKLQAAQAAHLPGVGQAQQAKVLIIQENGRHEKNRHFRECFALQSAFQRLGWQADIWGLGHPGFPNHAYAPDGGKALDWNAYDVILNLENYDETGWLPGLAEVKAYKMMWVVDAHVRGMAPFRALYHRDRYHLMLHSTRDFIVEEEDACIKQNSVWFPNCLNDALIYPQNIEKEYDIGFCGNIVNREPYLACIETSFQLKRDIFVIGADMVRAINSYRLHFNKNIANDINYRSFETIGCRTLLLTNANPQYDDLGFVDGENCLIYRDMAELREKIRFALGHPQERARIAENGYQLSRRHTYTERVQALITLLQHKL